MKQSYRILLLFFCFSGSVFASKNLDSLKHFLSGPDNEKKLDAISDLTFAYIYKNNDSAVKYGLLGIELCEKLNLENRNANFNLNLGNAYVEKADFAKALNCYIQAEKKFKATNDIRGAINSITNIGYVYEHQNLPETALMQYEIALKAAKKLEDKPLMAEVYASLGSVYYSSYKDKEALENFSLSLELYKQLNDEKKIIDGMSNLGVVYKEIGKLDEALISFSKLLEYAKSKKNIFNQIIGYHNIAITYQDKKNIYYTLMYLDSSATLAKQYRDYEKLTTIYQTYTEVYSKQKNFEKAFEYFSLQFAAKDSLLQQSRANQFIEMSTKYGTEKKDAENKLLKTEGEKQKVITIGISIGLIMVVILLFFIFRGYKQKQKANVLLGRQNNEIREKKAIIEEKQKEILDSITYAKRLQEAILPPVDLVNKYFESVFIYYQPKDIVAGDFYWMEHKNDYTFIAAADCTGHGVPGAMVSVVCSNALNRAVLEFNITDPGKILDKTRELVLETFSKSDKNVQDGMDISLLSINNKTKEFNWAGANNPFWYLEEGKIVEITADKQPIGKTDEPKPFTSHKLTLAKNSSVFLFTDGFADQFGGPKGKKFKYKELQSILEKNSSLSSNELCEKLKTAFSDWKGNLEQVDDVCIIGIKV